MNNLLKTTLILICVAGVVAVLTSFAINVALIDEMHQVQHNYNVITGK